VKTADIRVRCVSCDCYVEMADMPDDTPAEHRMGMCHANPPAVVMVPVQETPRAADIIAGRANGGAVMSLRPAAVFPVMVGVSGFCAHHPGWDNPPDETMTH
jgi:hypothetical protein